MLDQFLPGMQMMTSAIYGNALTPAALVDDKGNAVIVQHAVSALWLENMLRPVSRIARGPAPAPILFLLALHRADCMQHIQGLSYISGMGVVHLQG